MVPGLLAAPGALRLPALELLLARGRARSSESESTERWLGEAFGLEEAPLPAGALTLIAHHGDPGAACWARADPVHLRLMRDRLILAPAEAFALSGEEAQALCAALNRHFEGRLALQALEPRRWCARLEQDPGFQAQSPLMLAGRDVNRSLPAGAARAHALLNEAQMLLHEHPVNAAREARGEPVVNSIWLWGAGRAPGKLQARWRSVAAEDPVALGLARLAGARALALPDSAQAWLRTLPEDGRHLALLGALRSPLALSDDAEYQQSLREMERGWFEPLLAALRSGRIGMVTIHVPDAAASVSFETIRGDLRRFWRRAKALAKYAPDSGVTPGP